MRKALLISAMALGVAGCTTQQQGPSQVQVQDLSVSRERGAASSYTVEPGDTLYGIAWRHDMDFRELARLNAIGPPYRLQPGQELRLGGSGEQQAQTQRRDMAQATATGTQVSGAIDVDASGGNPDWLAPDERAIARNSQLNARSIEESGTSPAALGAAAVAGGQQAAQGTTGGGPGPIFNYDSPGADGRLSERDLSEREILERQQAQAQQQPQAPTEAGNASAASNEGGQDTRQASQQSSQQPSQDASQPATDEPRQQPSQAPDAGTAGGGEPAPAAAERSGRSYTPVEEVPWQWPVEGSVLSRFGDGSSITAGIDIGGQKGQPVKAAGPGIVVYAGSGVRGYGNLILLKHNDQFLSAYAHNESLRVKENDVVEAGEVIATMGDTDADGVKLHFEVRRNGQPQDPLEYLPSR
ncbi:peptidoglycan DD-metalloendopeptidase family protein [Litchfieldella xinjiangensis]|uniref:peptidoglycan DD-metalloendopeptidase family protein n=1 Tax=Litchfieldella xinjiangensis TaxID=1166948 RepID=UPI0005B9D21E|nr:peptidoglycan DD-metalloendopeptidase family protein [Halomonas xinjiangensis]